MWKLYHSLFAKCTAQIYTTDKKQTQSQTNLTFLANSYALFTNNDAGDWIIHINCIYRGENNENMHESSVDNSNMYIFCFSPCYCDAIMPGFYDFEGNPHLQPVKTTLYTLGEQVPSACCFWSSVDNYTHRNFKYIIVITLQTKPH